MSESLNVSRAATKTATVSSHFAVEMVWDAADLHALNLVFPFDEVFGNGCGDEILVKKC